MGGGSTNPAIDFGVRKLKKQDEWGFMEKSFLLPLGYCKTTRNIKRGKKKGKTFLGAKKKGLWEFLYLFHIKYIATIFKYIEI